MLDRITKAIIEGDADAIGGMTETALSEGLAPSEILNNGLMAGMDVVGVRFRDGDMFIPEVLLSSRTMHASLRVLKPHLGSSGTRMAGTVVLGTVKGDLHDIGKNLVGMMLEGAGFEVIDLGTDVGPEKFAEAVREHRPQIVGLSALLTTTMQSMKSTIEALEDLGVRQQVKVIVGGAPVSAGYAKEIGADGYGENAGAAVDLAKSLVGSARP